MLNGEVAHTKTFGDKTGLDNLGNYDFLARITKELRELKRWASLPGHKEYCKRNRHYRDCGMVAQHEIQGRESQDQEWPAELVSREQGDWR